MCLYAEWTPSQHIIHAPLAFEHCFLYWYRYAVRERGFITSCSVHHVIMPNCLKGLSTNKIKGRTLHPYARMILYTPLSVCWKRLHFDCEVHSGLALHAGKPASTYAAGGPRSMDYLRVHCFKQLDDTCDTKNESENLQKQRGIALTLVCGVQRRGLDDQSQAECGIKCSRHASKRNSHSITLLSRVSGVQEQLVRGGDAACRLEYCFHSARSFMEIIARCGLYRACAISQLGRLNFFIFFW